MNGRAVQCVFNRVAASEDETTNVRVLSQEAGQSFRDPNIVREELEELDGAFSSPDLFSGAQQQQLHRHYHH